MAPHLLTGGAGFIGSNLAEELVARGDRVIIADDLSLGTIGNIRSLLDSGNVEFVRIDLCRARAVRRLFERKGPFPTVFHLAANSDIERSSRDPAIEFRNTFLTTRNVLESMRITGCRELVFCSTSAVYGDTRDVQVNERTGPCLPVSYYGGAKLACEGFVSAYSSMNDMRAVILRFPNVVGDNATHGAVYDFVRRLKKNPRELQVLGDGNQEKPYLYVKDLVDAILFIRERAPERLALYNIGPDTRTKVRDIAQVVIEEMGLRDVEVRFGTTPEGWKGDVAKFSYDVSKLTGLGWRVRATSTEAVRIAARKIAGQWTR